MRSPAARYSIRRTRPLPCLDSLVCPFHSPLCLSLLIEPNVDEYLVDACGAREILNSARNTAPSSIQILGRSIVAWL